MADLIGVGTGEAGPAEDGGKPSGHTTQRLGLAAALGLGCLYLAFMNGHLSSIDGLVMWRQGLSLAFHHSLHLQPSIWWSGEIADSTRGIGASLQYIPGVLAVPWLASTIPGHGAHAYDFTLFYGDPLYTTAGAPAWVVITLVTAVLVRATTEALGFGRTASLWAMAFFGLGSPAFAAARGDFPQPLVALCWVAGIYACIRLRQEGRARWLWVSALGIGYGVLARPLEGSFLLPAALLLVAPLWRRRPWLPTVQVGAWAAAVAVTLFINWARFGTPFDFHYGGPGWTTPIWVGLPGALLSPGRGILWSFPALILAGLATVFLWSRGNRLEAAALAGLPLVLFLEACQYFDWVGGWDWGFRFFEPALPVVAILAGIGTTLLGRAWRWLPMLLLLVGVIWNVPVVTTDLLGGYGSTYADSAANFRLDAYPPIGAWKFLHHIRPASIDDSSAVDIVWFRATAAAGWAALLPFGVLVGVGTGLWCWVAFVARGLTARQHRSEEAVSSAPGDLAKVRP